MKNLMIASVITLLTTSHAYGETRFYDCEFHQDGGPMISGKLEVDWEPTRSEGPWNESDRGEGFLTIYTLPNPIRDVVKIDLPALSKRGGLGGGKVGASLREPFSKGGFGGSFSGLPGAKYASISCRVVG